jgi:cytochrome c peroxidase
MRGAARASAAAPARAVALTLALAAALAALALVAAACGGDGGSGPRALGTPPADFPPLPAPADNPITADKIALGRKLFFDKRLSRGAEVACASCHLPERAFADPRAVSLGVQGRRGTRNAPALINQAYSTSFFWDGGVDTLERQALAPIMDEREMDLPLEQATAQIAADPDYGPMFQRAFGGGPTPAGVTSALATFVRALVSGDSRWDRFRRGDRAALDEAEQRGREIFFGERGECFHCHDGFNLTNDRFANNGSYLPGGDVGRRRVTLAEGDLGRFKVPTLRNIAVTGPYMHDGALATLEAVIDQYDSGGRGHESTDVVIRPLHLTDAEKRDLAAFLRALTDDAFLTDPRLRP